MRPSLFAPTALLAATLLACGQGSPSSPAHASSAATSSRSPLEVVNARMSAYNSHDLDAFISGLIFGLTDATVGNFVLAAYSNDAAARELIQTAADQAVRSYTEIIDRPSK